MTDDLLDTPAHAASQQLHDEASRTRPAPIDNPDTGYHAANVEPQPANPPGWRHPSRHAHRDLATGKYAELADPRMAQPSMTGTAAVETCATVNADQMSDAFTRASLHGTSGRQSESPGNTGGVRFPVPPRSGS